MILRISELKKGRFYKAVSGSSNTCVLGKIFRIDKEYTRHGDESHNACATDPSGDSSWVLGDINTRYTESSAEEFLITRMSEG